MEKLTLENFNDLALDLLKRENDNSDTIQYYMGYDDKILAEEMEDIRKVKDDIGAEYLIDALEYYVRESNYGYESELVDEVVDKVLDKYVYYPKESEEYKEFKTKLEETLIENFNVDTDMDTLLRNTKVDDITICISPSENEKGNLTFQVRDFKEPELLIEELENDFSPIVFLIQSQGYEIEDLYDNKKVENSKFLKSLKTELENYGDSVNISIGFASPTMNFKELIDLEETDKNIIIPKNAGTDIVLEKDIVLKRENVKLLSEYCEEQENDYTYIIGGALDEKAIITDETAFEMHEVDTKKVYNKLQFKLDKEEYEIEEVNKLEYSDELKEKLNHYEKLNEKLKDKIDLGEFAKEIDSYKKSIIVRETKFERIGKDEFKNLSDIEEEEEFIIDFKNETLKPFEEKSPYLLFERYGLENKLPDFKVTVDGFDFFNSKNNNEKLEEKLKEEKDINIKDIVEFSNHIKETFKNNDVEILFEKENGEYVEYNIGDYLENTYDELLDNISEEAKVYRQAIKEEIDNITDKDGIVKEKDLKKIFDKYEISADYLFKNKEIKNIEVEEKTPEKEYTDNNELKNKISSYQQDIIEAVVENEFEKISKNEYKLKDNTLLEKENWEKELKTDKYKDYNAFYIFDNVMTRTEMVERYDLDKKLSPFEIYTKDGDLLYNSASENNDFDKVREYAKDNLVNYDFEEFINEDLTKFENWQKITTYDIGIGITELNGEKTQIYDIYDYTDPVYKELCQEIDKERVNFEEEIRLSFKEHIDNDIIKSDDILKVFEKFDSGNDKRLERFEKKLNNTEVSSTKEKEVEKIEDKEMGIM